MKRQRNIQQVKEQYKCPANQTKEEEIGNLRDKEFQIMIAWVLVAACGILVGTYGLFVALLKLLSSHVEGAELQHPQ